MPKALAKTPLAKAETPRYDPIAEMEEADKKEGVISEEEADKYVIPSNPKFVLNLEPDNFLSQYIAFGKEKSDAYPDYWFAGGLELLAIVNDRKTFVKHRVHDVYANVYINMLGRSSVSFKTSVMESVDNLILRIDLHTHQYHAAATSGSPEGWLEGLAEHPRSYCHQDESSQYLTRMRKNDYMAGMTEDLNKVFSGTSLYKRNTKKRSSSQPSTWEVKFPYYNQMYATTPEKFSLATTSSDIHSGFWVRFIHFYPNHPMNKFTPLGDVPEDLDALEDAMIKRLLGIQKKMENSVPTRMYLAPEGLEYYKTWQEKWHRKIVKTNDDFLGQIVSRYTEYVLKLGMLFTMGRSDFSRKGMVTISTPHIKEACRLVDTYFIPHALAVRDLIGEGAAKDTNLIMKIESILRVHGGRIGHRDLLRRIKVEKKQLESALETMESSGTICTKTVKNPHGKKTKTIFLESDQYIDNVTNVTEVVTLSDQEAAA